jgi:hypothetical protein
MPSIIVNTTSGSLDGGPVIGGITVRRPNGLTIKYEPVRAGVVLAGGGARTYSNGVRRVVALSWGKLTESEVAALSALVADPFVTYADAAGVPATVMSTDEGLDVDAVAGTFPVRYSVGLTLRDRDPS